MYFTRNERRGFYYWGLIIILVTIVIVTVQLNVMRRRVVLPKDSAVADEEYENFVRNAKVDSSAIRPYYRRNGKWKRYPRRPMEPYSSYGPQGRAVASFRFDPNTADSTALLSLGLSPSQVRNIYKYRAKGGQYHEAADFHRLYGLTQEQWEHLEPLIQIDARYQYVKPFERDTARYVRDTVRYPVKYTEVQTLPLNRCDTTALKHIPGVGSGYARMIIAYRERLGGFVSVAQLGEVEELPSELVKELEGWFEVEPSLVRRIDLNTLSLKQLKRHPYLNFYQAKVITEHRRLYGPLHSLADLRLYEEFTDRDFERLAPYVEF